MRSRILPAACLCGLATGLVVPCAPRSRLLAAHSVTRAPVVSLALAVPATNPTPLQFTMPSATTNKISRFLTSAWFAFSSAAVVIGLYMTVIPPCFLYSRFFDNAKRRPMDWVVQIWARISLILLGSKVEVVGAENLPPKGEGVLYCPNHCSFLDIFVLSAYLPRYVKYVSKIEILRIPLIGWAMLFARHIALRRDNRKSQLETFKNTVESLQAGNSIVTFPEGTRSKDGRISTFKKGPFTMAAKAGVRVVPVSIVGTHIFHPPSALMPIAPPRGVKIVIHPLLDAPVPKKEADSLEQCKAAVASGLPSEMQSL